MVGFEFAMPVLIAQENIEDSARRAQAAVVEPLARSIRRMWLATSLRVTRSTGRLPSRPRYIGRVR